MLSNKLIRQITNAIVNSKEEISIEDSPGVKSFSSSWVEEYALENHWM